MSKIIEEGKSIIKEKVPSFIEKITKEEEYYANQFNILRQQYLKQAQEQIEFYFKTARQTFDKNRKTLKQELVTLRYFAEHQEESHNLYPLFNQIDEKIAFNINIIQECHLRITLPSPSSCDLDDQMLNNKLKIFENYVIQLLKIVKSDNVRKYCKKESEAGQKVFKIYTKLLENVKQTVYCSQVKIKNTFEEGFSELTRYKHIEKLSLSLVTQNGILMPSHYHEIVNGLQPNRGFLKQLNLKFMDMQFSQQKCDILRKRLSNQLKNVRNVLIHNYYKECKLGQFQDFNWYPYRKKVNANGGVW